MDCYLTTWKRRSSIDVIKTVVEASNVVKQGNNYTRHIFFLVTLDVRHAFNSIRWKSTLVAMVGNFNIPEYFRPVIRDYLSDREWLYDSREGLRKLKITAVVQQGLMLGSKLWSVVYDSIRKLDLPWDCFLVAYAFDVSVVIA